MISCVGFPGSTKMLLNYANCVSYTLSRKIVTIKAPISSKINAFVQNNDEKKVCCRKGCLNCVDTPSWREKTLGKSGSRRHATVMDQRMHRWK